MTDWEKELSDKLSKYSEEEFNYIDTKDITRANEIDYGCSGVYMEASIIYFEIKNLHYILKESGRRKAAKAYTMLHTIIKSIADHTGAFVNCYAPNAFLIVYPGKEELNGNAINGAMRISYALSEAFKHQLKEIPGMEFAMGLDHGHIMGTKNLSDNDNDHLSWFGTCIHKAMRICKECARPFYIGISGTIYHNLNEEHRVTERRILGIKKRVEIWTKVTYQYDNVKKHLYQTNHKISFDEE